jgi:hypothetical protein
MKSNGRFFAAILAALALLLICAYIGWRVSHDQVAPPAPATASTATASNLPPLLSVTNAAVATETNDPFALAVVPLWLEKLDAIVNTGSISEEEKVQKLAELLPGLSPEAELEYSRQMSFMLDDTNYTPIAKLLLSPSTSSNVFNNLFNQFITRGNALKLPMYVEMMQIPNHVYREQARQVLTTYLQFDYGDDWKRWETAVDEYLKMTRALP